MSDAREAVAGNAWDERVRAVEGRGAKQRMLTKDAVISTYTELSRSVKAAGLLERRPGYYWALFGVLSVGL